ncbi:MAG: type II toxin-antitoxin system VapC family toxin [Candidatus Binatia bacterium]
MPSAPSVSAPLYVETSAALRWLFNEAYGDEVLELLRGAPRVVSSRLTIIEGGRSIERALAAARILETQAAELRSTLSRAAAGWQVLEVSREVATRAEQRFPVEPIRTLDAIHLSSALALRQILPALRIVSTDLRVRKNGLLLGFEVLPVDLTSSE